MPEFISKLQYNTYEKGEYSDEKVRGLEDTLLLVNDFPWDGQRGADVQLTGPSVTIHDESGNYLKVGLYFGGKYCIYFLDCDNHLYEYHAPDLEDANIVLRDFFNGQIELTKFDKHLFNIGNKGHFFSRDFIYRVKAWRVILTSAPLIVIFLLFFSSAIAIKSAPFFIVAVPLLISMPCGCLLIYILNCYLGCSDQVLQISSGNNSFSFANSNRDSNYNKEDIKQIIVNNHSRNVDFILFEICFKDESVLKLTTMLISEISFRNKFPSKLFVFNPRNSLWRLHQASTANQAN